MTTRAPTLVHQMPGAANDLFECVINVSEGQSQRIISTIAKSGGRLVLDVHSDPDHHRSVLTLAGPVVELRETVDAVARTAISVIDLRRHTGAHPRLGALDVVPWVALLPGPAGHGGTSFEVTDGPLESALVQRRDFAVWAGSQLGLPCFYYGPERSLPAVRKGAWKDFGPDTGPRAPHPTAGSAAVGARTSLVAYNLWLAEPDLALARRLAAALRAPAVRTLGFQLGNAAQVSCNLIDPWSVGPGAVFDAVASQTAVARAELVGLIPAAVLAAEPKHRWSELGLDPSATIEARLEQAGLDGGRFGTHGG